jgi:beta-glucosidase
VHGASKTSASGMSWTYAPSLSVAFDDHWGGVNESFSEQGRGGPGSVKPSMIACGKHFAGDGQTAYDTGKKGAPLDRGDAQIDEAALHKYGLLLTCLRSRPASARSPPVSRSSRSSFPAGRC